jgi:hypothetical protein
LEDFYTPGSPVFIYDVGESDAGPEAQDLLGSDESILRQIVREFNGIGIVWEHRYYGKSTPFNISLDTPSEQFQWLSVAQALADIPVINPHMATNLGSFNGLLIRMVRRSPTTSPVQTSRTVISPQNPHLGFSLVGVILASGPHLSGKYILKQSSPHMHHLHQSKLRSICPYIMNKYIEDLTD